MKADQNKISLQTILQQEQNQAYCCIDGLSVNQSDLLNHAVQISHRLPENAYAINLCQNRYLFTVAYLAVILKNQINLLPPNQAPQTINRLIAQYRHSYCLIDRPEQYHGNHFLLDASLPAGLAGCNQDFPHFDPDRVVSISFTSGSTGVPKAIHKTWQEFQQSAELAIQRFKLKHKNLTFVATVPPQHMYGLETSVFWPLFSNNHISSIRPFFPEDIRRLIAANKTPCLLISTPTHLKACVNAGLAWQNIAMILSSTAPMPADLAKQVENSLNAPLFEIFGSTETLSFASRRLTKNVLWKPYRGVTLTYNNGQFCISGGHLSEPVISDDQFHINQSGLFSVSGRSEDLVKIAGKRASLKELNQIINAINGIDEAVFFRTTKERLAALVVSRLSKKEILYELKQSIDEVFLPRPMTLVKQLPRNEIGKIIKAGLEQMLEEQDIA